MRRLHDLWRRGRRAARAATPDSELLERFVHSGDHAAFAELVDRLGPLVYGACRRLLPNPADVEDAFQATFLVLVRRADTLAGRSVGPWLHRVAVWTARNFRRRNAVLAARPLAESPLPVSPSGHAATDARLDVDAAVSALPERYRVAVILCHLQGWTRRELAAHLGCPESTASSLVGRGLAKLKKRLAGRDPAVVLAVAGAAAVPPGLATSAVRAAALYRTSSLAAAASPAVAELTEGVLRMFRTKQLAAGLAAAVAVVGIGIGLTLGEGPRAEAQSPRPTQPAAPADDAKTAWEKLDKEIDAAKERVKQLEKERARLEQEEAYRRYIRRAADRLAEQRGKETEPYIGLWVRPPRDSTDALLRHMRGGGLQPFLMGGGSEYAINEIYGNGKPVVEAHFYDVRSLQTYLTRAAKDPAAPKKLKLDIDKDYPAAKVKAALDACKAAGFTTIELVSAAPAYGDAFRGAGQEFRIAGLGDRPPTDEGFFRSADLRRRTIAVVRINQKEYLEGTETAFTLHRDAYPFDEQTGKRREWTDLKEGQRLRLYLSTHEGGSQGMPVLRVGMVTSPKPALPAYVIEAPDVLKITATVRTGATVTPPFVNGEFVVRPDGTVGLGSLGALAVSGLTLSDVADAVRRRLAAYFADRRLDVGADDVLVTVDVAAHNSKRYYVITDGKDGEQVQVFPLAGSETVRDAVNQVAGLSAQAAESRIWVSRPARDGKAWQTLPVDWTAITRDGATTTNYQLLPGDRLYVKPKKEAGGR